MSKISYQDLKQSIGNVVLPAKIQKIYSSAHFIVFKLRSVGLSYFLYLGRGDIYNGIWPTNLALPSSFRTNDSVLDMFRKRMEGGWISNISLKEDVKQVSITYHLDEEYHLYLIFKDLDLFFAFSKPLFFSWKKNGDLNFDELYEPVNNKTSENPIGKYLEKYGPKVDNKRKEFLIKKKNNIENDLKKLKMIPEIVKRLDACDLNGKDKLDLELSFKLNPKFNHFQNLNLIYTKIKSLKKVAVLQENRLQELNQEILEVENKKVMRKFPIINPIRITIDKYLTFKLNNKTIMIGRNQKENNEIRKIFKNALWFHQKNVPGAHLFIDAKLDDLSPLEISVIGSLLVSRSKFKVDETWMIVAPAKNLRGISGGKVTYSGEKILKINFNKDYLKYLTKLNRLSNFSKKIDGA